jgi:hypothetical protein
MAIWIFLEFGIIPFLYQEKSGNPVVLLNAA